MKLRLIGKVARQAFLAPLLLACMPPPQDFNAAVFAQRAPPAGRPTYLETIKYIDDGLRHVDPTSAFYISPDGRMCFRGVVNVKETSLDYIYNSDWCLLPTAMGRVDSFERQQLSLFCKHAYPHCIREIGYRNRTTDIATVGIVPSPQERVAIEHLIYLMGGSLGDSYPLKWPPSGVCCARR